MVIKNSKMDLFNNFFLWWYLIIMCKCSYFFVKFLSWLLIYRHKNSRFFSAKLVKNTDLQFLYKLMATGRLWENWSYFLPTITLYTIHQYCTSTRTWFHILYMSTIYRFTVGHQIFYFLIFYLRISPNLVLFRRS